MQTRIVSISYWNKIKGEHKGKEQNGLTKLAVAVKMPIADYIEGTNEGIDSLVWNSSWVL
jgi:hypothetical protein